MKWLPRSARAHPARCACAAAMSPRSCFRSFVFLSIFAICLIESPTNAFTIRRVKDAVVKPEQDQVGDESTLVEVKHEFTKGNVKVIELQNSSLEEIIPAQTTAKVYRIKGDYPDKDDEVELTTAYILLKTNDGYLKITGLPVYTSPIKEDTSTTLNEKGTYITNENENILRRRRQKNVDKETTTTSASTTDDIDRASVTTQTSEMEYMSTPELKSSLSETFSSETTTVIIPPEIASAVTDYTSGTPIIESKSTRRFDSSSSSNNLFTKQAQVTESKPSHTTPSIPKMNSTPTEFNINEPKDLASEVPTWRKYTTIERKREGNIVDSTSTNNKTFEETIPDTPTRVTLAKLLNESTPSLKELSNTDSFQSTQFETETFTSPTMKATASNIYITETDQLTLIPDIKKTSPRILQVSSKRAGFLDYSAKPVTDDIAEEATTIIENIDTTRLSDNGTLGNTFEGVVHDSRSEWRKEKGAESQSQLVEDAIKEELLKEEMLSDNEENFKQYRIENLDAKTDFSTVLKSNQKATEDTLSVKPINYEKDKSTKTYTVSPNYKPLKKIEVQPQKPFLRDPDDNSWRNESISSLGIVFKPKAASKNYTQVLKNKTEALLNGSSSKDNVNGVPDLRERLEKITEVRKSKKKKVIDKFGDTVYSDYEEGANSAETTSINTPKLETTSTLITPAPNIINNLYRPFLREPEHTTYTTLDQLYIKKHKESDTITTAKPKKYNGILEYYDTTDEYDVDYINLPKIDLKKYTPRVLHKDTPVTTSPVFTKPATTYLPERKPTLEYFPPRVTHKVNINDYDRDFQSKVNLYTYKDVPKNAVPESYATVPTESVHRDRYEPHNKKNTIIPTNYNTRLPKPAIENTVYRTDVAQHVSQPPMQNNGYIVDNGNYDRGSYVIKHYKDLIDEAVRDNDYEKNVEYVPYTQSPIRGVTVNDLNRKTRPNANKNYDYETDFRKDILNRFVDNFNKNSERFKVDFPILYNNSVVHRKTDETGKVRATSTAFVKRLYGEANTATKTNNYATQGRPCENCDNINVDLSPAYELHYYVPEQEEREEAEPRPVTLGYQYTL
ncbi:uncharacterized protein ACR2FA_004637 [Aphomia sociella]